MTHDLTTRFDDADRILVFGGPYSNLQATQAMRAEAERLDIPACHVICTGDVVAYCAHPTETVAEVRQWGVNMIVGNCEQQLAADADNCACGFEAGSACDVLAKGWYAYADGRVGANDRAWMSALPDEVTFTWADRRMRVVHGACGVTNRFVFRSERDAVAAQLATSGVDIVIAGHSGIPFGAMENNRLWFNAGVIGQPANDGTPDGWFGLLERSRAGITASLHRLPYAFATARHAILSAGYADPYGETLGNGLWPNTDILPPEEKAATGMALTEQNFLLPHATNAQEFAA